MDWYIYDENGNLVNTIHASESYVIDICNEHPGWTYAPVNSNPTPNLYPYQQALIAEFENIRDHIFSFLQDHGWANSVENFNLATRQYDAMIEYYLVLNERIVNEGIQEYVSVPDYAL